MEGGEKASGEACGDKNNSERQREDVASVKLKVSAAQRKRRHVSQWLLDCSDVE